MPPDNELNTEVAEIKSEVQKTSEIVKQEADQYPKRNQISRAERAQIAVGIAVATTFVTLVIGGQIDWPSFNTCTNVHSGFTSLCALSNQFVWALGFLLLKSTSMTLQPVFSRTERDLYVSVRSIEWNIQRAFECLNRLLPALYVSFLLFSVIAVGWILIRPEFVIPYGFVIYNILQIVVLVRPGFQYADEVNKAMDNVRTSSTEQSVTVSRGPRGTSETLYLHNDTDSSIEEEEIYFIVSAPNDVQVRLEQAYEDPSRSDRWIYPDSIGPNREYPKEVDVRIKKDTSPDQQNGPQEDHSPVIIYTYQDDELVEEDKFEIR